MNTRNRLAASVLSALVVAAGALAQTGPTNRLAPQPPNQSAASAWGRPPAMAGSNQMAGNPSIGGGLENVKSQIRATDEEWKVISPLLQSVLTARQTAFYSLIGVQGGMGFGDSIGNRGGRGGGFGGPGFLDVLFVGH